VWTTLSTRSNISPACSLHSARIALEVSSITRNKYRSATSDFLSTDGSQFRHDAIGDETVTRPTMSSVVGPRAPDTCTILELHKQSRSDNLIFMVQRFAARRGVVLVCAAMVLSGCSAHSSSTTKASTSLATTAVASSVATTSTLVGFDDGHCANNQLPFRPGFLPDGWDTSGPAWSGVDPVSGKAGRIEIADGLGLPTATGTTLDITVLGHSATIGEISDGFVVRFVVGPNGDLCNDWALIAHPYTTRETLQQIAEQLID
jgi:hypothetical protein